MLAKMLRSYSFVLFPNLKANLFQDNKNSRDTAGSIVELKAWLPNASTSFLLPLSMSRKAKPCSKQQQGPSFNGDVSRTKSMFTPTAESSLFSTYFTDPKLKTTPTLTAKL